MKIADILNDLDNEAFRTHQWVLYRACRDFQTVSEAARRSISRVLDHLKNATLPVVLITAFRQSVPELAGWPDSERKEREKLLINRKENQRLARVLSNLNYSFFPVIGRYKYTDDVQNEQIAEEESFFVLASGRSVSRMSEGQYPALRKWLLEMMTAFKQESVLVKYPGNQNGYLIFNTGTELDIGPWTLSNIQENWTRMRYGANPKARKMAFQSAQESAGSKGAFEFFAAGTADVGEGHAARCFLLVRQAEFVHRGKKDFADLNFELADFRNQVSFGSITPLGGTL